MADQSILQKLANMLKSSPPPTGSGMVNQAAQNLQMQPQYRDYVINAQTNGQAAAPYDQWLKMQGNQAQPIQTAPQEQQQPQQPFRF